MKGWKFQTGRPLALVVAALIFLIPAFTVFAQDDTSSSYMAPERVLSALQKEVTIQEKTSTDVLADLSRYFVTSDTIITMGDDTLPLSEMPVPCRAMIFYEKLISEDPEAVKIEILDFSADAGTGWTAPIPE